MLRESQLSHKVIITLTLLLLTTEQQHSANNNPNLRSFDEGLLFEYIKAQIMTSFNVTVIGIGAMGGGMARALLESSVAKQVQVYDQATTLVVAFHEDAQKAGKTPPNKATKLSEAVTAETDFVLLVLQNEPQCETVCFGAGEESLLSLVAPGTCVILSSTVTAVWAQGAAERFAAKDILFVDCPISGGPVRARQGELTLMASGSENALTKSRPVLDALGSQVHIIEGGAGMGSTVKMVKCKFFLCSDFKRSESLISCPDAFLLFACKLFQ